MIVSDKQLHLQYLNMDAAITHCTKGIGIWDWASNDQNGEPDLVMASAGDIPTQEALAATLLLREDFPDLKIRFINVVDLFKLQPNTEHPHGLTHPYFDSLFTTDKPIMFNFHGYPWLIHRLAYRRKNRTLHVRGYKEKGNINTPMELAMNNEIDRFSLAIDAIDRVPKLQNIGGHAKERFRNPRSRAEPTPTSTASIARRLPGGDGRSNNQLDSSEKTGGHPIMSILERVAGLSKPRSRKQILACLLLPALLSPASAQELPAGQGHPAARRPRRRPRSTRNRLPNSCSSW